jgi:hypothetical protein
MFLPAPAEAGAIAVRTARQLYQAFDFTVEF